MDFDFIKYRELENLIPIELKDKEKYHLDLINIHQSWTGRADAMFANHFFRESIQLIINAIALFEKGYFDCAFYSLRQSLELATTVVYFVDDEESNRIQQINKWKSQERFPLHSQMINELNQRRKEFADIRDKMSTYFEELDLIKQKLNKYVHKQGLNKFYTYKTTSCKKDIGNWERTLRRDFETYLKSCIGAVAVFRLAIDPLPILLADEDIYKRTGQFMTEGYHTDFISNYIGDEHINAYKKTEMYQGHYNFFIAEEEMSPSVLDIVKHEYIDRSKIEEISSQKHLLGQHDLIAMALVIFSEKIVKIYCIGGLKCYFTNIRTKRISMSFNSQVLNNLKEQEQRFNNPYDEVYLSYLMVKDEDYFIEHNDELTENEIEILKKLCTDHNTLYISSIDKQSLL